MCLPAALVVVTVVVGVVIAADALLCWPAETVPVVVVARLVVVVAVVEVVPAELLFARARKAASCALTYSAYAPLDDMLERSPTTTMLPYWAA